MRNLWYKGVAYNADNKLPAKSLLWDGQQLTLLALHSFAALACKNVLALRIEHGEFIRDRLNPSLQKRVEMRLRGQTTQYGPYQRRMGMYKLYHPRLCEFKDMSEPGQGMHAYFDSNRKEVFLRLFGEWFDLDK